MAKTLEERIDHYKAIAEKHGYVLLEECLGYKTPVLMCCKKHPKYKTKITLEAAKKHHGCPYCAEKQGNLKGIKIPYDIVVRDFSARGYTLLTPEKEYKNSIQKLAFICPKHGERFISYGHLREGKGCALCAYETNAKKALLKTEDVEHELKRRGFIWLDKKYEGTNVPLKLSCVNHPDKIFYLTYAHVVYEHIKCPYCTSISRGEKIISYILDEYNIDYIYQKRMKDLYRFYGQYFSYDFYIPSSNTLIEYQGEYHDKVTNYNTPERLADQQIRDRMKREYAEKNGYNLIEIWYTQIDDIEQILREKGVII